MKPEEKKLLIREAAIRCMAARVCQWDRDRAADHAISDACLIVEKLEKLEKEVEGA